MQSCNKVSTLLEKPDTLRYSKVIISDGQGQQRRKLSSAFPAWYIWSPPTLPSCVVLSWLPVPGPRIVVFRRLLNSLMCCTSPGTRRWSSVGLLLILLRSPSALEWSTTQTTLQLLREVALFLRGALMLGGSPPTVALLGGSPPLPYGAQVGSSSLLAVVYPYPSGQPVSCTSSVLYLHRVR